MPRPASVLGVDNLSIIDHPPLLSGSMPSGHALAAISCALIVCTVFKRRGIKNGYLWLIALAAGIAAWARVAVGAHWPSDVIAGAGLAISVVAFAFLWERHASWNAWFQRTRGRCVSHSIAHPNFIAPGDTSIGFLFCAICPI
jgi:membrane-associated phospholipid phosphatase